MLDRVAPPRQRTPIPGARRHYGDHDPSQLAKTDEAIYGIDTDTNPARLHEHAAAEAAGSDSQKIAAASRHAKTSMIGEHGKKRTGAPHLRATVDEVIFGHDTDGSLDVAVLTDGAAFEGAAAASSSRATSPSFAQGARRDGPRVHASNVDRVVFGHDIDGSEAAAAATRPTAWRARRAQSSSTPSTRTRRVARRSSRRRCARGRRRRLRPRHRRLRHRDALTELPEYAGAAGVPTSEKNAACTSAPPARRARTANPNMRATVDEVVFGHDIDGSAAATPSPPSPSTAPPASTPIGSASTN